LKEAHHTFVDLEKVTTLCPKKCQYFVSL